MPTSVSTDGRIVAVEPTTWTPRRRAAGRRRGASCPAWSTPTSTSTSRAAPTGRASRPRPARRPRAASRRSSTCRSTASRRRRPSRRWRPSARPRAARCRRRRVLGRRRAGQPRRPGGAARRRRVRLQVLPARTRASTSSRTSRRPTCERRCRGSPTLDALLDRARRGPARRCRVDRQPATRDFLDSRPRRGRGRTRSRTSSTLARATGARVHVVHLSSGERAADAATARGATGVRLTAETCPHYLTLAAEEIPDGATEFKCCPPIRDAANREALWQRAARRHDRPRRHRPLAVHRRTLKRSRPATSRTAWGGIASLQLGLPRGLDRGAAARPRRSPTSSGWMSAGPGRPGRPARARAAIARGARRRPRRVRPGRRRSWWTAPAAPPQPASRRTHGRTLDGRRARRRGCAGSRSTTDRTGGLLTGELSRRRRMTRRRPGSTRPARPGAAALGGGVVWANDELFAERENLIKPGAGVPDRTTFGTRARSTTAGRPGAGASAGRATRRSCGSACPAWCAGSSSTPRSSRATTRRTLGRGASVRRLPERRRAAPSWVDRWSTQSPLKGDAKHHFEVAARAPLHPRAADHLPRRRRRPAARARRAGRGPATLIVPARVDLAALENGGVGHRLQQHVLRLAAATSSRPGQARSHGGGLGDRAPA